MDECGQNRLILKMRVMKNHERRHPFIKTQFFSNAKQKMQENFPNLGPFLV